jgi:hypothetical protein
MPLSITPRRIAMSIAATLLVLAQPFGASPAGAQQYLKAGTLTCDVSGGIGLILGSSKQVSCRFVPDRAGPPERYAGSINKIGLDIGFTGQGVIVWLVLASASGYQPYALAGDYAGLSADASVGVGVGANALIGGSGRGIVLQPISVQAQTGINLAVGIGALTLRAVD